MDHMEIDNVQIKEESFDFCCNNESFLVDENQAEERGTEASEALKRIKLEPKDLKPVFGETDFLKTEPVDDEESCSEEMIIDGERKCELQKLRQSSTTFKAKQEEEERDNSEVAFTSNVNSAECDNGLKEEEEEVDIKVESSYEDDCQANRRRESSWRVFTEESSPQNIPEWTDSDEDPEFDVGVVEEEREEVNDSISNDGVQRRAESTPWKLVSEENSFRDAPEWKGSIEGGTSIREPIEYFRYFFDDTLLDLMVAQSNLYSMQSDVNNPLNLDRNELEQFIGTLLHMSMLKISSSRLYWSRGLDFCTISDAFPRKRWESIKSSLYFVDSSLASGRDDANPDKLFKIRPFLDHLRAKFRTIPMPQLLSIDEIIIPFKGESFLKQYNPTRPLGWGYKVIALCDTKGFVYDFVFYDGKVKPPPGEPDLGASSNAVLHLAQTIPPMANHIVCHDNWFTSSELMVHLAKKKIHSVGTVRINKLKGISKVIPSDKEMLKLERGSYIEVSSTHDDIELRALKWVDNSCVTLLSSFSSAAPVGSCKRHDKKKREPVDVPCPKMIQIYNEGIGGVDLMDTLVGLYRIYLGSHKYYHKIFFHFLDVTLINAWLLHRRDCNSLHVPRKSQQKLQEFKLNVAQSLLRHGKDLIRGSGVGGNRVSAETAYNAKKRKGRNTKPIPTMDIRKDGIGHWPMIMTNKERPSCKNPGCKNRSGTYCSKCNVALCLKKDINCFVEFHKR